MLFIIYRSFIMYLLTTTRFMAMDTCVGEEIWPGLNMLIYINVCEKFGEGLSTSYTRCQVSLQYGIKHLRKVSALLRNVANVTFYLFKKKEGIRMFAFRLNFLFF